VLEWHDELGGIDEMVDELGVDVTVDRIYVLTPEGHVVDLSSDATPIDFAYKVHTDVGHRCRGAKVNGRIVPLNKSLKVGDQVEILTGSEASPSRDWLNSDLGFVRSARARAKIKHWFKSQDRDVNIRDGKDMLTRELRRFNISKINMVQLAESVNLTTEDDLYAAIGANDIRLMHVVHHAEEIIHPAKPKEIQVKETKEQNHSGDLMIRGVGNMLTTIANCCKPVPGDSVAGYITLGRGVSIHRDDCVNLLQLRSKEQERIIDVSWGNEVNTTYPVDLHIIAYDRTGLLRDIMTELANIGINVIGMQTMTDKSHNSADMKVTVEVEDLNSLGRIMSILTKVPNISDVRRVYSGKH
jgi:GTP pyrophosphokinase